MAAEPQEPIRAPETPPASAAATPEAPKGGGGMSPMLFFAAMAISWIVMLGGGFALVQFVLPSKIADALKQAPASTADATKPSGEAPAPAKAEDKGHAEVKAGDKEKEKPAAEAGKKEAKPAAEGEAKGGGELLAEKGKEKPKEFVLSEVIVNIAGTRGARFVKASVFFDAPPDVLEELESQRARIIDLVSTELGGKTMDELTAPNARGTLREELTVTCNGLLKKGQINNLYFVDFLIQ